MKKLLLVSGILISAIAGAQETCGLQLAKFEQPDPLFRNGFENFTPPLQSAESQQTVPAKSAAAKGTGLGPALSTVPIPVLGIAPTITITFPANNATVSQSGVQLEGTFTGTGSLSTSKP